MAAARAAGWAPSASAAPGEGMVGCGASQLREAPLLAVPAQGVAGAGGSQVLGGGAVVFAEAEAGAAGGEAVETVVAEGAVIDAVLCGAPSPPARGAPSGTVAGLVKGKLREWEARSGAPLPAPAQPPQGGEGEQAGLASGDEGGGLGAVAATFETGGAMR